MKKLPLYLLKNNLKRLKSLPKLNRKYHTIILQSGLSIWNKQIKIALKNLGSDVHEIEFRKCTINSYKFLLDILRCVPKVQRIIFASVDMRQDETQKIKSQLMKKLTTLVLIESDWKVPNFNLFFNALYFILISFSFIFQLFEFFSSSELEVLKVKSNNDIRTEYLTEFLSIQHNLETLALRNINDDIENSNIFESDFSKNIKFKLKHLSIDIFGDDTSTDNLKAFLQKHEDSLEDLEIGKSFADAVYEYCFTKFRNLKKLTINADKIPKDSQFYNRLRPNISVKKLIIRGKLNDFTTKELFGQFPKVETLVVNEKNSDYEGMNMSIELMIFMSNNLNSLKHLVIPKLPSDVPADTLKFPALKSFHIERMTTKTDWTTFIQSNPTIERLSYRWLMFPNIITKVEYEILAKSLLNLQYLTLGSGITDHIGTLTYIAQNFRSLKVLNYSDIAVNSMEVLNKIDKESLRISFYIYETDNLPFPEEVNLWSNELKRQLFDIDEDFSTSGSSSGSGGDWQDNWNSDDELMDINDESSDNSENDEVVIFPFLR